MSTAKSKEPRSSDDASASSSARTVLTVRVSATELAAIDALATNFDCSRSQALRLAIEASHEALESGAVSRFGEHLSKQLAARQPVIIHAEEDQLSDVQDALAQVTKSYATRAREINYIGHNLNQLLNLAHAGEAVDSDALNSIAKSLTEIRVSMTRDAERDAEALEALQCLSS